MRALHYLFITLAMMASRELSAQDVHFSQFNDVPLSINPALTGSFNGLIRTAANYRSQWNSLDKGYTSYSVSADFRFLSKKKGQEPRAAAGLYVYNDKAGAVGYGEFKTMASFAYNFSLNPNTSITFGLQGGFGQTKIDDSDLQWGDQYNGTAFDPERPGERLLFVATSYSDFAAGAVLSKGYNQRTLSSADEKWYKIGVAAHHLSQPVINSVDNTQRLKMRYVGHAQFHFGIKNNNLALEPSGLVMFQGPSAEYMVGNMFVFGLREASKYTGLVEPASFGIGLFYRVGDAVVPAIRYSNSSIAFGISYDLNVGGLRAATGLGGGPEFLFKYTIPNRL